MCLILMCRKIVFQSTIFLWTGTEVYETLIKDDDVKDIVFYIMNTIYLHMSYIIMFTLFC